MITLLINQISVQAETVRSVETDGSIGFYGIYESEIEPKPVPPNGKNPVYPSEVNDKSNDRRFPKTGQLLNQQWFWLGIIALLIVVLLRTTKQREIARVKLSHH